MQLFLSSEQREQFEREGFLILRALFSPSEIASLREHFMALHAAGPVGNLFQPKPMNEVDDILQAYPRFMHPHRVDEISRRTMLDARYYQILRELLGEEPISAQSMFYWKPPGARGQALHQDNFYLTVAPGSCYASWLALDPIDAENGGLFVVPGSHKTDLQCPHLADFSESFAAEEVDLPAGMNPIPAAMNPGDCLFFNGSLIHGSYSNKSKNRFRRSFICHYLGESSQQISRGYFPLYRFDGTPIEADEIYAAVDEGGVCGSEDWQKLQHARGSEVTLA